MARSTGSPHLGIDPATSSSILYDTVAVQLAADERHLGIEALPLVVDDRGATRIDPAGRTVRVATEWRDRQEFDDLLVARLAP